MDTLLKIAIFFFPLTWALCVDCTQAYDGSPTESLDFYLQSGNTMIEDTSNEEHNDVPGDGVSHGTNKEAGRYASVNACEGRMCMGRGTCHVDPENENDYKCLCEGTFEGKDCEIENPCEGVTCHNRGTCDSDGERNDYNCSCEDFYTGKDCETVTFCVGVNCRNRGTCGLNEDKDDYECTCESPYTGKDCEIECTCPENSICVLKMNGTKEKVGCLCNEGYHFKDGLCKEICNPNPCRHGQCSHFGANSYSCKCNHGYIGVHCDEEDIVWKVTYDSNFSKTLIVGVVLGAALLVSVVLYWMKLRSLKRKGSFDLELQVRESKFYEMPTNVPPTEEQ